MFETLKYVDSVDQITDVRKPPRRRYHHDLHEENLVENGWPIRM